MNSSNSITERASTIPVPSVSEISVDSCTKPSLQTCLTLNQSSASCFGSSLPYSSTSFDLVSDANNLGEAKEKLLLWSGLRAVPKCWDYIQPLLCSVYFPKCEEGEISLPDRSVCQLTRGPCRIVQDEYGWPDFLTCTNDDIFRDNCDSLTTPWNFNKSECELPLISTSNPASYYDSVEGCGLQCMNPLFNQTEHDEIHAFVAAWASTACLCTFFAMMSFIIDWKNASKYPARIIFYINLCFFLGGIGWLAQFFAGAREEIVCRKDGTMRLGEPVGTGESPSCVIIFVLVYYFLMAGITWFDILAYSWFLMFEALGTRKDPLIDKAHKFHLTAWSIPFILMVACLAVSQIDGDSMSGICFIGYKNYNYRFGFLLVPVAIVLFVGGFFLCRGLRALFRIRKGSPGLLSDSAISKINWTMIRIGIFTMLAFIFVSVSFAAHIYDYTNQALWEKSFRDYIKCEANVTILEKLSGATPVECVLHNHPNLSVLKLNLVALFGTGIVMSTWVWTKASFDNWRRAWYKLTGQSDNEMKRIKRKSRIIAKAFAIRNVLQNNQKKSSKLDEDKDDDDDDDDDKNDEDVVGIEYTEHTMSHQDPLGMDFDLHSVSQELSSTWVRNVPKMVQRRGGILPEDKPGDKDAKERSHHHRHRYYSHMREREAPVEPGLWAVSQYIDGSNMKTKPEKMKLAKKTAPSDHYGEMFIGTSPYNFPTAQAPRRLPPVLLHDNSQPYLRTYTDVVPDPNYMKYEPQIQSCVSNHCSQLPAYCHYPPGFVDYDESRTLHRPSANMQSSNNEQYYEEIDSRYLPAARSFGVANPTCAFHNSNSNGNRVHVSTPRQASSFSSETINGKHIGKNSADRVP